MVRYMNIVSQNTENHFVNNIAKTRISSSLEDLLLAQEVTDETDTELDIRNIGVLKKI